MRRVRTVSPWPFAAAALIALAALGPAAPVPPSRDTHRPAPIDPAWRVEACLLRPLAEGPPEGYTVVSLKDRDPAFTGYFTQETYYEKGNARPRRILRYHANGRLAAEIDNVGKDQHNRE